MRAAVPLLAPIALLVAAACSGGGGGGAGEERKAFVVPHILESSGRVARVAVADVDCDGAPDLLVHDPDTASVQLFLSTRLRESPTLPSVGGTKRLARGAAAYEPGNWVLVWDSATDLAVGDLDGDGRPDLVVAGGSAGEVGVWSGDVTGTGALRYHEWRWQTSTGVTGSADRVAIGDVNGDGRCDIVTLEEATGQAHVLLQSPVASFDFVVGNDPPAVGACRGLVLIDLDRDGHLDVVTNRPDVDAVAVVHGVGLPAPMLRESPTLRSTGRSFAVGDVDGDGFADVVVLGEGGSDVVSLRQRSAQPGFFDVFDSPLGIAVNEEGIQVASISIDEPGVHRTGIAVNEEGTHNVGLAIGSQGSDGRRAMCTDGLCLADVDRDGVLDLLATLPPGDPDFDLLVAFGIRESPTRFATGEQMTTRLRESPTRQSLGRTSLRAVCDLDGDGCVDAITGDPDFDLLTIQYVEDGVPAPVPEFTERLRVTPTSQTTGFARCDLDRDGLLDLATATNAGMEIRYQDSARPGTFLPAVQRYAQVACAGIAVGDVNRDGSPDLVSQSGPMLLVCLGDPAAPRSPVELPPQPLFLDGTSGRSLALGDLDGDGAPDCVAIRESPSKASLGRSQGNGFFDVFVEIEVGVASPRDVAVADLDGDGRPDLAVCGNGECSVVRSSPSGPFKFDPPQMLAFSGGVRVASGDVNGDGRCDVVTSGPDGVAVALQSPVEDGVFLSSYALSTEECSGLALCDLDRDGALDACFVETKTGTVVVVHGDPDFDLLRIVSLNGLPPGEPVLGVFVASGDLDGDGFFDVFVACPTQLGALDGTITVFGGAPPP